MKNRQLERHLTDRGCRLARKAAKHELWENELPCKWELLIPRLEVRILHGPLKKPRMTGVDVLDRMYGAVFEQARTTGGFARGHRHATARLFSRCGPDPG